MVSFFMAPIVFSPIFLLLERGGDDFGVGDDLALSAVWVCDNVKFSADFGLREVGVGEDEAASVHEPRLVSDGFSEWDAEDRWCEGVDLDLVLFGEGKFADDVAVVEVDDFGVVVSVH